MKNRLQHDARFYDATLNIKIIYANVCLTLTFMPFLPYLWRSQVHLYLSYDGHKYIFTLAMTVTSKYLPYNIIIYNGYRNIFILAMTVTSRFLAQQYVSVFMWLFCLVISLFI